MERWGMLSSIEDVVVCSAVLSQGRVDGVGWLMRGAG